MRAVLGQQVSTAAARTHAARLVTPTASRHGPRGRPDPPLPRPAEALAGLDPAALAMPRRPAAPRSPAWSALWPTDEIDLSVGGDRHRARAQLSALPGSGPGPSRPSRCARSATPTPSSPTDLGVRAAARELGLPATPAALTRRAAAWRPWRAYAVQYLWATGDHPINHLPTDSRKNTP